MGFPIDQNASHNLHKNYMKNIIPGAHLSNSLYSDIPGLIFFFYSIINLKVIIKMFQWFNHKISCKTTLKSLKNILCTYVVTLGLEFI